MSNQQHPVWEFLKRQPKTFLEQMLQEALYVVTTHSRFAKATPEQCWDELVRRTGTKNVCEPTLQVVEQNDW